MAEVTSNDAAIDVMLGAHQGMGLKVILLRMLVLKLWVLSIGPLVLSIILLLASPYFWFSFAAIWSNHRPKIAAALTQQETWG